MSMKPNYFKIGVFVIVAFILILIAIVVFGSGLFAEEKVYFETYFDGSVSGLSAGVPVEYRGVRIGRVEKITFVRNEYEIPGDLAARLKFEDYIMVISSADEENLPALTYEERRDRLKRLIKRGLRIRLASNILTGQAFLQANYLAPEKFPPLEIKWEPKRPYIPSAPGEFTTIKQSVDHILSRLEKINTEKIGELIEQLLASVNRAIDDANVPGISSGIQGLVANVNEAIDDVNVSAISDEIQSLFVEARQTNQHLQKLIKSPRTESQTANIAIMVAQLNRTLIRIDKLVSSQTPQIEQALEDLRKVSANLEELTKNLKKHPAELIFSQPPPKSEVPK